MKNLTSNQLNHVVGGGFWDSVKDFFSRDSNDSKPNRDHLTRDDFVNIGKDVGEAIGASVGLRIGTAVGSMAGSRSGPVGMAVGSVVGGAVGTYKGKEVGNKVGGTIAGHMYDNSDAYRHPDYN